MITPSDAKQMLTATKEAYDNALLRVLKNGPTDVEGHQYLLMNATRYDFLLGMTRAYFPNKEL